MNAALNINEDTVEQEALQILRGLGYDVLFGPDIAPGEPAAERTAYDEVILPGRVKDAIEKLNLAVPVEGKEEAFKKLSAIHGASLVESNQAFHKMLVEGVDVEYLADGGRVVGDKVWLLDFENPANNEFVAVNQFTVTHGQHNRRPDIVLFVNGLPLGVIELKNPFDENATVRKALNQLETYKAQIPTLFSYNELLVISDGRVARLGSLTADWERFMPWRTIDGLDVAPKNQPELDVLLQGILEPSRLLDFIQYYVLFHRDRAKLIKIIAGYHQYHAVNKAVTATIKASSASGDKRIGVIWHTQGSGKSLSMTFYAAKIARAKAMDNPTLVVLTDRNDLDDQLFGTFSKSHELLRQIPVQAEDRPDLRTKLNRSSGGVVFTTIQKFMPEKGESYPLLSDRRNIVFIADEAHRSQYDFIDGFARHMRDGLPNASFIGFTGTPIELADKNTPAVFGDYIDIYDIHRAVEDGATVRIYYESRLAKIDINREEIPKVDEDFEEITEEEETSGREKLKSKWARLEALVGTEKRVKLVAQDIVDHFEKRIGVIDGKGMIVCMSRRICVDLYNAIIELRPHWHNTDHMKGVVKVVMSGSASDPEKFRPHLYSKKQRDDLAARARDIDDPLKLVIVRDMWLTGFDAPCMHTMYVDKPMHGHGLMQAIARVNRVFRNKPGGLIVDYLGIADQLKRALAQYSDSDKQDTGVPQAEAVALLKEKHEAIASMLHGFEYSQFKAMQYSQFMALVIDAEDYILKQEDGKKRFVQLVVELSKAFALAVPHEEALALRDEVAFFQYVKASLQKHTGNGRNGSAEDYETAIRQIIESAVVPDRVVDIFAEAGLDKPDISILSDEFLEEIKGMPQRNLALETLRKLLNDELKVQEKRNLVQARAFSEMLEGTIRRYQNRTIEAAEVINELISIAKDMRAAKERGEATGLTDEEIAFYDALAENESAKDVLGDDILRAIARDLVKAVRSNYTVDWTKRDNARAKMKVIIKRLLKQHGYPPDKTDQATETVLAQAELMCEGLG